MTYYEFDFTYDTSLDIEIVNDVLAAELGEIGFESFTSDEKGLQGFIPATLYNIAHVEEKLAAFPLEGTTIHYSARPVEDKDWNEEWEKNYFQPIHIGNECQIRASLHPEEPGFRHNILIDPKMAFGTGNHETTYLMIQAMLASDLKGQEVLDMGCGTAVLAILAHQQGAKRIVAIDIDEWAYNNALENIHLNQAEEIQVLLGGAERIAETGTYDTILANINRNILLHDIHHYAQALKEGGQLIMSGFYEEDCPMLEAECRQWGLEPIDRASRNKWTRMRVIRKNRNN
ncbi:MAG: 50S ribosomal protein L11 methyltransferase [bacterium]|nr:50S ribosomal protein L11 methyltransferase [bacterium]